MNNKKIRVRMITEIILKEYGIYLLAMLSAQPLMWKILGLVDWSWITVSVAPAAFLLIGVGMVIYYTISYWVENYRMGITFGDLLIRMHGAKYFSNEDERNCDEQSEANDGRI